MGILCLKVGRLGRDVRVLSWIDRAMGTRGLGPLGVHLSEAEAGEFDFLVEHGKDKGTGAGGQFEYRVYETLETPEWPYAIVRPHVEAVRRQYPDACRIVNMKTGEESALSEDITSATTTVRMLREGKGRGSFN